MSEKEVSEALFSLRKEIDGLPADDADAKATLEGLLDELEDQLESTADGNHLHLVEDMKDALAQFEVEHPTMTGILNQLLVTLGGMGI